MQFQFVEFIEPEKEDTATSESFQINDSSVSQKNIFNLQKNDSLKVKKNSNGKITPYFSKKN